MVETLHPYMIMLKMVYSWLTCPVGLISEAFSLVAIIAQPLSYNK